MNQTRTPTASAQSEPVDGEGLDWVEFVADSKFVAAEDRAPVRFRELVAIVLLVALFDLVVYRGNGYAGLALGFVVSPLLLWAGAPRRGLVGPGLVVFGLMVVLSVRMVWLGTAAQVVAGLVLVAAFAMTLSGRVSYVLDTLLLGWQTSFAGAIRLREYAGMQRPSVGLGSRGGWLKVLMPLAVVLVFGAVFVQANPDLARSVREGLEVVWERLNEAFGELLPSAPQLLLWCVTVWLTIGLLRPVRLPRALGWLGPIVDGRVERDATVETGADSLVPALRNTLLAVIVLFAAYLVFEFQSLWFREFPKGFYYAGYAHEGAAWLTAALVLATLLLSAVFRGRVLADPAIAKLKRLAWFWSSLNVLLAIAVYHRLSIYVEFNGMTRMRFVGLVGVTTVLAGFLLVVWKIAKSRGFLWLIERQLWALALGLYVLAVFPMDAVIHRYNVSRILAGDPAPVVQITEHDVDDSGLAVLGPLLDCDDPEIRRGIAAMLTERLSDSESMRANTDWTTYQVSRRALQSRLEELRPRLMLDAGRDEWRSALGRFRSYAFQWY
ncbi:MAG: DUF4173 domain-containing protein [Planctomycetaceae bacterium]|nr:DUF4173 domain-containing protein [Planctomycetaceae bacterium]